MDVKTNFKEIIDYDSIDEDEKSWGLIYKVEGLEHEDEINLVLNENTSNKNKLKEITITV